MGWMGGRKSSNEIQRSQFAKEKKELQEKHRNMATPQKKESPVELPPAKKPKLDEPPSKTKVDLDLVLPEKLIAVLVDDWENVTKQQMLVSLPRSPTVAEVLDEYFAKKTEKKRMGD